MSDYILHDEMYGGKRIVILPDDGWDMDPRVEHDNLGIMICFHGRHSLGDQHDYSSQDFTGWDDLERHLIRKEKACLTLPLWLYDHSGLRIQVGRYTGPDAQWDSGQVGFIYTTKEMIRRNWGIRNVTKEYLKKAEEVLCAEVSIYDSFISGDICRFEVRDFDGDVIDSCGGFIGCMDECIQEAKGAVDYLNMPAPPPPPKRPSRKLTIVT